MFSFLLAVMSKRRSDSTKEKEKKKKKEAAAAPALPPSPASPHVCSTAVEAIRRECKCH